MEHTTLFFDHRDGVFHTPYEKGEGLCRHPTIPGGPPLNPQLFLVLLSSTLAAPPDEPEAARPAPAVSAPVDNFRPDPAWKPIGPRLWFDAKGRRLVMRAKVVLREGPLEHLLCLTGTKEHEAILATSASPRLIHAGLLLTGAEPGHPVRFLPEFQPPAGTAVAIDLEWTEGGEIRRADARDWVLDERKKVPLAADWVFAGSELVDDPATKQKYYLADDGDLITVANFASAILDLPLSSSADDSGRSFVARTERIPPRGTAVTMYFHPRTRAKPATPKTSKP